MLENLFKSKTVVGVIKTLILNDGLHIRELARRINVTPIYVKKELANLRNLGIVEETRKGNLSIWSLNKKSTIYNELKQIFFKTDLLVNSMKSIIEEFNPDFAFVYGSFASGKENQKSDIDLFLVGTFSEDSFLRKLTEFEQTINREVNYILWSKKEFICQARKKHHLLQAIKEKPILWLRGDELEFRRIVK